MKEEIPRSLILLIVFVLIVGPQLLVRTNFFRKTYAYRGVVTDGLDGLPLDLVEVRGGSGLTYTDKLGQFEFELSKPPPALRVRPRRDYENPEENVACRVVKSSWRQDSFTCLQTLYPQPFDVAGRVLAVMFGQGSPTSENIRSRKEKLWSYLSTASQKIWQSQNYLADLLTPYEETSRRLKVLPLSSRITKEYQLVREISYLDRPIRGELARVEARLFFADGREEKRDLYFLREGKLWKYLIFETPPSVQAFNEKNIWVFRKK